MNKTVQDLDSDAAEDKRIAEQWLQNFNAALGDGDDGGVAELLAEDSYWRDLLAYQWDFRPLSGRDTIASTLISEGKQRHIRDFAIDSRFTAPYQLTRSGRLVIEVIVKFRTGVGTGNGVVRLEKGGDGIYRGWGLMTSLQTLDGYPEAINENRPERVAVRAEGENWLDRLEQDRISTGEPERCRGAAIPG